MPRSKERNAEYMRDYRARRPAIDIVADNHPSVVALHRERDALLEEVRHLKEELAKRPPRDAHVQVAGGVAVGPGFNTHPFTPVPKKGSTSRI